MVEMLSDIGPGLLKEILDEEKKKLFQYCPDIYTRHQLISFVSLIRVQFFLSTLPPQRFMIR